MLTAEELLAGAEIAFDLEIPGDLIDGQARASHKPHTVKIRPLTFGTFQLIMKSAREDPGLIPLLMVKEGLAEPRLSIAQVKSMPIGLLEFILEKIREQSGLSKKKA